MQGGPDDLASVDAGCMVDVASMPVPLHGCGTAQVWCDYPSEFRVGIRGRLGGAPLARYWVPSLPPWALCSVSLREASRLVGALIWEARESIDDVGPEMVPRACSWVDSMVTFCSSPPHTCTLIGSTTPTSWESCLMSCPQRCFSRDTRCQARPPTSNPPANFFLIFASTAQLTFLSYADGIPKVCPAQLLFGLGPPLMFLLLLIVTDISRIDDDVQNGQLCAAVSLLVFVCAAVATVLSALGGAVGSCRHHEVAGIRWTLTGTIICCGVAASPILCVEFLPAGTVRVISFHSIACDEGICFGAVFMQPQKARRGRVHLPPSLSLSPWAQGFLGPIQK